MIDDSSSSPSAHPPLPDWISSDLLEETKSVWRAEYGAELTAADAVDLLQTIGGVFEIIYPDEDSHEYEE